MITRRAPQRVCAARSAKHRHPKRCPRGPRSRDWTAASTETDRDYISLRRLAEGRAFLRKVLLSPSPSFAHPIPQNIQTSSCSQGVCSKVSLESISFYTVIFRALPYIPRMSLISMITIRSIKGSLYEVCACSGMARYFAAIVNAASSPGLDALRFL